MRLLSSKCLSSFVDHGTVENNERQPVVLVAVLVEQVHFMLRYFWTSKSKTLASNGVYELMCEEENRWCFPQSVLWCCNMSGRKKVRLDGITCPRWPSPSPVGSCYIMSWETQQVTKLRGEYFWGGRWGHFSNAGRLVGCVMVCVSE